MEHKNLNFKIFRFEDGEKPRYDIFQIREREGMTILDALFQIQDELDGSLAFRYSCRGAVCGSCAMLINKVPGLACRIQTRDVKDSQVYVDLQTFGPLAKPGIGRIEKGQILVEPLPNLPVIKDLVVDMEQFFKHYESIKPWLVTEESGLEKEHLMEPEEVQKLEKYTNCILCAACYGTCPVSKRDKEYLGPAALAKVWRFFSDSRDTRKKELLEIVDSQQGVWGCDGVFNCVEVCPKEVPPTQAITALRRRLFTGKVKRVFGRK